MNKMEPQSITDFDAIDSEIPSSSTSLESYQIESTNKMNLELFKKSPSDAVETERNAEENSNSSLISTPNSSDWIHMDPSVISVHRMVNSGVNSREILRHMLPSHVDVPPDLSENMMMQIIMQLLSEPPKREKLAQFNTLDDAVELLKRSNNIIVLTGAGVSVSCGIPDFRSRNGVYARLHRDFPDLPNPQAMFDIEYFRLNPRPFFDFARVLMNCSLSNYRSSVEEIYPGQFQPSISHRFIKALEESGKLLRNYTQNIDTLEQVAGIEKVVQCHGSFATASCCRCQNQVSCDVIRDDIFSQTVPMCPHCSFSTEAVMKPDIVFFGENLPPAFHQQMSADKDRVDLLIIMGSSLKVRPVALIPGSIPAHVPQLLINRNRQPTGHCTVDMELIGFCDHIVVELCRRLGGRFADLLATGTCKDTMELIGVDELDWNCSVGPATKKQRTTAAVTVDSVDESLWSPRFVSLVDRLPSHSFLFVPPNRSIFHGAELLYDLDSQCITNEIHTEYPGSSSGNESTSSGGDSDTGDEVHSESAGKRNECHFESRSASCPHIDVICS